MGGELAWRDFAAGMGEYWPPYRGEAPDSDDGPDDEVVPVSRCIHRRH